MKSWPSNLSERVSEVAKWCSLQALTSVHIDSREETRRRELIHKAGQLLDGYHADRSLRRHLPSSLIKFLPAERLWAQAMSLLEEADADSLAPLEHQLRHPSLRPAKSIGGIYCEEERQEIVKDVIDLRSSLLGTTIADKPGTLPSPLQGRLLLYVPSENVSDGASRYSSNGFYDPYDCPPWDLWLHYADRTLISWVPEILFPLAQAGIEANPIESIQWAD